MIPESSGIFHMLITAGPVVKMVLLILFFFSVTSWAIILIKFWYIRKACKDSVDFIDIFWQCRNLSDAFFKAKALRQSPVARIFISGYMEMKKSQGLQNAEEKGVNEKLADFSFHIIGNVKRALRRSINLEIRRLGQLVPFLATAGNTAPFIGLFGTVWGIMSTFHSIGLKGAANLAVVAPGISEALVATAAGLVVAIPSVIGYNYFTDRIKVLSSELENFSADFLNIVERDILADKGV